LIAPCSKGETIRKKLFSKRDHFSDVAGEMDNRRILKRPLFFLGIGAVAGNGGGGRKKIENEAFVSGGTLTGGKGSFV